MKVVTSVCFVPCLVLAIAVPAFCQEPGRSEAEPFSRIYVSALAGASFASETRGTLGAEYGERINDLVQAYANITYFDNLMSDRMRGQLVLASNELTGLTGMAWDFDGRDRGLALTVGAKFLVPTGTAVRPYVGAGAGALNVRRTITEASRGDVTEPFVDEFGAFGFTDGIIGSTSTRATKPLGEAIAGVNILAGRAYVDLSYRHRRAFRTSGSLSFSQFAAGVGVRF